MGGSVSAQKVLPLCRREAHNTQQADIQTDTFATNSKTNQNVKRKNCRPMRMLKIIDFPIYLNNVSHFFEK